MGNTESFEMCEITSEVQCQDRLLYCEIGILHCTCGKMSAAFRKEIDSWTRRVMTSCQSELSDQEKSVSWSSTRTGWKATNVSQSPQYSQEGKQKGLQNHVGQIPEQSALSRLIDSHCMGWEHLHCIWRDRKRGQFLRCDKRRKKPKWEITTSERRQPRSKEDLQQAVQGVCSNCRMW